MEEDRAANQRSAISLSLTLALYIRNGLGLRNLEVFSKLQILFQSQTVTFIDADLVVHGLFQRKSLLNVDFLLKVNIATFYLKLQ